MWPFSRKAIAPPPERKSVSVIYPGGGLLAPAPATYPRLAEEGYGQNAVAYACTNKIATAVASVEPQLFRKGKGGKAKKIDTSPLLDLLDRPNALQSGRELIGQLVGYFALSGNAYLYGNGLDPASRGKQDVRELQLLNPGKVRVKEGKLGYLPESYEFKPTPAQGIVYPVDQISGKSAVLHLKTFNPVNPWYGMAPMQAAALAIDMHNAGNLWNYSLLKRGARPAGALVVKGMDGQPSTLSEEQYLRVKEQIDNQYSGAENAGRPLLLEGGLEWQEMSINPKDMEFLEGKNSAARDIALAFGVPPQLIGIPGDATYSNYEQATLAFWTETVLPMLQLILGGLNRWLTPLYGDGLYLWYDEEMIPALEPLRKAKGERINAAEYMKIDEKREAMGLEALEDGIGDTVLVASSDIPLELAGEIPELPEPGSEEDEPEPEPEPEDEE